MPQQEPQDKVPKQKRTSGTTGTDSYVRETSEKNKNTDHGDQEPWWSKCVIM